MRAALDGLLALRRGVMPCERYGVERGDVGVGRVALPEPLLSDVAAGSGGDGLVETVVALDVDRLVEDRVVDERARGDDVGGSVDLQRYAERAERVDE